MPIPKWMLLNLLGPRVVFLLRKLTVRLGPGVAAVLRSFDILVLAVAQLTHSRRKLRRWGTTQEGIRPARNCGTRPVPGWCHVTLEGTRPARIGGTRPVPRSCAAARPSAAGIRLPGHQALDRGLRCSPRSSSGSCISLRSTSLRPAPPIAEVLVVGTHSDLRPQCSVRGLRWGVCAVVQTVQQLRVSGCEFVLKADLHNPYTMSGNIIVEGVVASSHSSGILDPWAPEQFTSTCPSCTSALLAWSHLVPSCR